MTISMVDHAVVCSWPVHMEFHMKDGKDDPRCAGNAQHGGPIFYRAPDRIFLATLSPREFRRATDAGSKIVTLWLQNRELSDTTTHRYLINWLTEVIGFVGDWSSTA